MGKHAMVLVNPVELSLGGAGEDVVGFSICDFPKS
jgi:hypothetical protein